MNVELKPAEAFCILRLLGWYRGVVDAVSGVGKVDIGLGLDTSVHLTRVERALHKALAGDKE